MPLVRRLRCLALASLAFLLAPPADAMVRETEPETRNSPLVAVPAAVKLRPFSGGASYRYPFDLPPGTGHTPELVLTYSSLTKNTPYGWGWSLGGLSRIERCTRFGPPSYDDAQDIFELDGDVLVRDPDSAPTANVVRFHKRHSDHSRILYDRTAGLWEVTRPDGTRLRYGARPGANSVLSDGPDLTGNVFRWALDEVVDPQQNAYRIDYESVYDTSPGFESHVVQIHPRRVRYSFHSQAGIDQAKRLVELRWGLRAYPGEKEDRPTSFRSGFKIQTTRRLTEVLVGIDADGDRTVDSPEQIRRYTLTYAPKTSAQTPREAPFSKLVSIQRHGDDDTPFPSAAAPSPSSFEYTRPERGFKPPIAVANPPYAFPSIAEKSDCSDNADCGNKGFWDMNGDGILDYVQVAGPSPREWVVNYGLPVHQGGPGYGPTIGWQWCDSMGSCSTAVPAEDAAFDDALTTGGLIAPTDRSGSPTSSTWMATGCRIASRATAALRASTHECRGASAATSRARERSGSGRRRTGRRRIFLSPRTPSAFTSPTRSPSFRHHSGSTYTGGSSTSMRTAFPITWLPRARPTRHGYPSTWDARRPVRVDSPGRSSARSVCRSRPQPSPSASSPGASWLWNRFLRPRPTRTRTCST